ncbi:MAG: T9SS type A sorting domain-containing protein [Vicingaceae bacterium]
MLRKTFHITLFISLSLFFKATYAQINFERNDSIIVLNENNDTLKNPWVGGFNSVQFSEIDLNLDGIKDLFVFDRTGNRISTFINTGVSGLITYIHAPSYINNFPKNLKDWVLLRDYNCDGKIDIFSSNNGQVSAYKNTSATTLSFVLDSFRVHSDYNPDGNTSPNNPNGDPVYLPLNINSSDIPVFDDIDNDGDVDILTFSILGSYIEYHKNLSIEKNGDCSDLDYQLSNKCWGFFHEKALNNGVVLNDTCNYNINNPQKYSSNKKHSGSTLLTLDIDANNSKELVLGDVSYDNFVMLTNGDASPNLDNSYMTAYDSLFPQNNNATQAVKINVFPAGFYIDVNNDNIKDLIASPNCKNGCVNNKNVYLYNNIGATNQPNFNLNTNSFLQEGMIEVGEGAHPVFFDYNNDGLQDIAIGNFGVFVSNNGGSNYKSSLFLYENIGTLNNPSYQLIDSNYIGISSMNLDLSTSNPTQGLHPTFGDLDNDNDLDLILGDYNGKVHFFRNTANAGAPANFVLSVPEYSHIDVGQNATPLLYDINNDNLLDLIIGSKTGEFTYYQNNGTLTVPNFVLITDSLGNVSTKDYNNFDGNSNPIIIDSAGTTIMYSGSKSGNIYKFGNIDGNLTGTFSIDSSYLDIWEGVNSIISVADVNSDGNTDLLVGNYSGGIAFYKGNGNSSSVGIEEKVILNNLNIYPNPTKNSFTIDTQNNNIKNAAVQVINMLGKTLVNQPITTQKTTVNLNNFSQGIYLVKFYNNLGSKVFKVVKE